MKSELYRKFRRGRHGRFRTRTASGSGNVKGKTTVGAEAALSDIQQKLGRKLNVVKTEHTKDQWVFCEKKGTPRK